MSCALSTLTRTFAYPLGFYSTQLHRLQQLQPGATVAIANDATNQGRALNLLAAHQLIQLKPGVGLLANVHDIIDNPHHYHIITMAAAQLPRALSEATLVAMNNDFLRYVNLQANDAIIREAGDGAYSNIAVNTAPQIKPF